MVFENRTHVKTGLPTGPRTGGKVYDPRIRPWYVAAMNATGGSAWSDVYIFAEDGSVGITAARQILTSTNQLLGVSGGDYKLSSVEDLLLEIVDSEDGTMIYVVDNNGYIISSSIAGAALIDDDDWGVLAVESPHTLISVSAKAIISSFGSWADGDTGDPIIMDSEDHGLYYLKVQEIKDDVSFLFCLRTRNPLMSFSLLYVVPVWLALAHR